MTARPLDPTALAQRVAALASLPPPEDLAARDAETARSFQTWCWRYDQRNTPEVYVAPALLAELARRHLPAGAGPILDLACGTGLLGAALHGAGFTELLGTDLSEDMLARAAEKGIYSALTPANLHAPLPFAPQSLAAVTCCGAFYAGSVEVMALAHALPLIRPGGHLVCDVEMEAWEDCGYARVLRALEQDGQLALLHCEPIQMFRPGGQAPDDDPNAPQGMAVVARMADPLLPGAHLP